MSSRIVSGWKYLALAAMVVAPNLCVAASEEQAAGGFDGYLGLGVMWRPNYVGSATNHAFLAPIANFDYDDIFYWYVDRAGVRFWSTADRKVAVGIAAQPRWGYSSTDGPLLAGMHGRSGGIEGGPTIEWQLPVIAVSVAYFTDLSDTSDGQALNVSFFHQLIDRGPWDIGIYANFDYANKKVIQYYFGVRPDEATLTRPAYRPGAALNSACGLDGAYRYSKHRALLFGVEADFLGAAASNSPIVEEPTSYVAYVGVGVVF